MTFQRTAQEWRRHAPRTAAALASCLALLAVLACAAAPAFAGPRVVVTIKPVHALVAQVMAGVGEPTLLVSGGASPHGFALKPSDARALQGADIFFRVSESVEPFTARLVATLPDHVRVVTLADAEGVIHLDRRTAATWEGHEHTERGSHDADHDGTKGPAPQGSRSAHSSDGHVWLDPENAKAMVTAIARALAAASPENAERFEANAAKAVARLDALEARIRAEVAPLAGKPFVVFHDAYQYFERRFGVTAVGSITVSPEIQPSARRLSEIRAKIGALGVSCVFAEPTFSPRLVAAVLEDTEARSGVLDPEGMALIPGPDAYDTLLENLASSLAACLAAPKQELLKTKQ